MLRIASVATLTLSFASVLSAQQADTARKATPLAAVTVTATRTARTTFDTPQPVTVFDSATMREKLPHGAADLFKDAPGLDASGVGPNQRRPEIRLQGGQRILLLENGLRLNNSRRQSDFGELPALAGIGDVSRVEVVRGPSSVLYGTDAIGGVVNLITQGVPRAYADGEMHGSLTWRYGSAGNANTPTGTLATRVGRVGIRVNGAYREAQEYNAPNGSFGNITLNNNVPIFDSGIHDGSYSASVGYDLTPTSELYTRAERYQAGKAGFGWIDPASYSPNDAKVQIVYPDQDFSRVTVGYRANAPSNPFATRTDVSVYIQGNKRHLNTFVLAPAGPGATVDAKAYNFTNVGTIGGRVELARSFFARHVLTYGVDAFRDKSRNTDSSRTTLTGFGPPPPIVIVDNTPNVPNAIFQSAGAFAQLELNPIEKLTTVIGGRVQDVMAKTLATPGLSDPLVKASDHTGVYSANVLYRVLPSVNFVTAVGRGFRAANLVERFFNGQAAEGNGWQSPNPDLGAETSLNVDVGLRARRGIFYGESFVFRNDIHDAIRPVATGNTIQGMPEFRDENVGKLRVDGLELLTGADLPRGFDATASWTRFVGSNVSDPTSPIGDSYSSKLVGDLAFRSLGGRFTAGYTMRYQGEQKDVIIGSNPIGTVIPSFVVHSARASVHLFDRRGTNNSLALTLDNIGNKLYAEFPNASFFRPEPGRSVTAALISAF